jgi:hypothetical protein
MEQGVESAMADLAAARDFSGRVAGDPQDGDRSIIFGHRVICKQPVSRF